MKTSIKSLTFITAILAGSLTLSAQTYTMNWGSSFSPAWTAGSSASRTTTSIGASGLTATVSFNSPEANAMSSVTNFSSPMVSSAGNPFNTQLGTNVSNLAVAMDLASNANYVDITVTFSGPVSNVNFNIADIDKLNATSTTYYDEVRITGLNGTTAVAAPILSKLNGTAVNTVSDTVRIVSNIARANSTSGAGGNSPSNTADQNATVVVNFGAVSLTSVTIRYRNATGADANPAAQAIAIGNISFQKTLLLPVTLTSFSGYAVSNRAELSWQTAEEYHSEQFVIEQSTDGKNWSVAGTVKAAGTSNKTSNYHASYEVIAATNYYRLKQVDIDGQFSYSKTVIINSNNQQQLKARIFPNPVTTTATLSVTSPSNTSAGIALYSISGVKVREFTTVLSTGINNISLAVTEELGRGNYIVIVTNNNDRSKDSYQFTKQ